MYICITNKELISLIIKNKNYEKDYYNVCIVAFFCLC